MNNFTDYLAKFLSDQNPADLIGRVLAQPSEIQVQIRQDIGQPVEDTRSRTHDGFTFHNIRYPSNAATTPDWSDRGINYPLSSYADRIGSTGFTKLGSRWVGFDFDTIAGHKHGRGLSDDKLALVADLKTDYVEVRRSTGGKGIHLYVMLEGFDAANHTEHAAIGRAILCKLKHDTGFDFNTAVDTCGGNLWFWTREPKEDSFRLIKPASKTLTPTDVPDWRSHLDVVSKKRNKVFIEGLDERYAQQQPPVTCDEEHTRIIEAIRKTHPCYWVEDHNCYHTHTAGLKAAHTALELRGPFETVTSESSACNCFVFLMQHGAMRVVRFGTAKEHGLWEVTAGGLATYMYNAPVTPKAVARAVRAPWNGKGFSCGEFKQARNAVKYFGHILPKISDREFIFQFRSNAFTVQCPRMGSSENVPGWGIASSKQFRLEFDFAAPETNDAAPDNLVRYLQSGELEGIGYTIRHDDGQWGYPKTSDVRFFVKSKIGRDDNPEPILGRAVANPWRIVSIPYAPRFLPGRQINRGIQLIAAGNPDQPTPSFDSIRQHCGEGLDTATQHNQWCRRHGVRSGADYLLLYQASLIQRPAHPLPVIVTHSVEQNTGKSSLQRSTSLLFIGGSANIQTCLNEQFNQQMAGAVLCYWEEFGIKRAAYLKIKGWVEAPTILIREMRCNAYSLKNFCHFMGSLNDISLLEIEKADERFVIIPVKPLETVIPWKETFEPLLIGEAPHYLAKLQQVALPPSEGRCYLPILATDLKREAMNTAKEHAEIVPKLVQAIVELIDRWEGSWSGTAGELLEAIGTGPWSNSPATLAQYLRDSVSNLSAVRINVRFSDKVVHGYKKIHIGWSCCVDPEYSAQEMAEDEERVSRILDIYDEANQ